MDSTSFNAPMRALFEDEVLGSFCYDGTDSKKAFKNLKISNLLFGKY